MKDTGHYFYVFSKMIYQSTKRSRRYTACRQLSYKKDVRYERMRKLLVDIDLSLFPASNEDMFYTFTNMQTEKVEVGNENVSIKMTIEQAKELAETLTKELKNIEKEKTELQNEEPKIYFFNDDIVAARSREEAVQLFIETSGEESDNPPEIDQELSLDEEFIVEVSQNDEDACCCPFCKNAFIRTTYRKYIKDIQLPAIIGSRY